MKFKELKEWADTTAKKDNATLIAMGVKIEKLSKIKSILKEGISVRCSLIINNTEKNNKYTGEIEEYIKQLTSFGLNPIKEVKEADHA